MTDISLIRRDPITGVVTLGLGTKALSGIQKLCQIVILSLLNTPGKDIIDPERGAGIPSMIAGNFDPTDFSEIVAEVTQRVRTTESEVITSQAGIAVPANERLRAVTILSIDEGDSIDQIAIRLRIENELGQLAEAQL